MIAGATLLFAVLGISRSFAAPIYIGDNGVAAGSAGYTPGNDAIAGNYFTTIAGFELVTGISVYWGQLPGAIATLAIIDDPNGDGSLADGVVLGSVNVSPSAGDVGSFVTYAIAPVTVSAGFFVAAYINDGPGGLFPMYFDTSGVNFGGSRAVQFQGTLLGLAQAAVFFPENATWMIRAEAQAVPEPASIGLLAAGLVAGVRRMRKKA